MSEKLGTLMEGESLLNDGTAIVLFSVFYNKVLEDSGEVGEQPLHALHVVVGEVGELLDGREHVGKLLEAAAEELELACARAHPPDSRIRTTGSRLRRAKRT